MAKSVVKPTPQEQVIIDRRLRKMYPQMYSPGWGVPGAIVAAAKKKRKKKKRKKKELTTVRTQAISERLKQAGLSDSDIARLRGK